MSILINCSFCGKNQDEVEIMVAGPGGMAICDTCVAVAVEAIDDHRSRQPSGYDLPDSEGTQ